jgi:large subunit ribosomal protein L10
MKVEAKQQIVNELAGKLEQATAFYLTDFTGLNVKRMTALRRQLREAGVEYFVVKNTLAQRAIEGLELPDIAEFFSGPTGLVIGRDDAVTAAKVLDAFAKEHDDRPSIKIGIVERQTLTPDQVGRLAKLPPREKLLAELAGAMQAPAAQLAFLLQGLLGEVVGLLEALRAQREGG